MEQSEVRTAGVSPKAVLAFVFPFVATLGSVLASWIVSGNFNEGEVRTGASALVASAIAALGAYLGKPGAVVTK